MIEAASAFLNIGNFFIEHWTLRQAKHQLNAKARSFDLAFWLPDPSSASSSTNRSVTYEQAKNLAVSVAAPSDR
jgi:hypothetical protein